MSATDPAIDVDAKLAGMQRAVRWYPPRYDLRVEDVPIPSIIDADDAIVKVKLAGLCGSDLHIYRGHEDIDCDFICGHEIIGEVVALGTSFHPTAAGAGRPELYSTLKIGDKVVSPFTISCGECHFCRIGFTSRCTHSRLFGSPALSGGQAQYIRIPKAGGTLFNLGSDVQPSLSNQGDPSKISDSSLLLLADILPTGAFAAIQALQHPKVATILTGKAYPFGGVQVPTRRVAGDQASVQLQSDDRTLTIAVVGLGPVGVCAVVSLLHILADLERSEGVVLAYQVIAIDPLEARRLKMEAVYKAIHAEATGPRRFYVASIDEAKEASRDWTNGVGCNAVLEVVGNNSALTLAYDIVRPFGVISSVGVHQEPPLPFNGRNVYDKNISFDFGRCPVRAMFPIALEILPRRQDIFGGIGEEASLIDRVVSLDDAPDVYEQFDKGKCGKILFDPWL